MRKTLWIILALLIVGIGAPVALADTTDIFDITASPGGIGGTLTVDVTNGTVTAVDITATGLTDFTDLTLSAPVLSGGWVIIVNDPLIVNQILLDFTTTAPGSLVGFDGGTITFGQVAGPPVLTTILFTDITGTIAPAVAAPEPSSVALMLLGVGLVFVMRKRIGQRLPQAS
jgi:hypothetical protein